MICGESSIVLSPWKPKNTTSTDRGNSRHFTTFSRHFTTFYGHIFIKKNHSSRLHAPDKTQPSPLQVCFSTSRGIPGMKASFGALFQTFFGKPSLVATIKA